MSDAELEGVRTVNGTSQTVESEFEDQTILCIDCNTHFVWTVGEQIFFRDKKLQNPPKRCKECKQAKNERLAAIAAAQSSGIKQRIEVAVTAPDAVRQQRFPSSVAGTACLLPFVFP